MGCFDLNWQDFNQALDANYLVNDLNQLIFKLIGLSGFVQPYEMSMSSVGLYVLNPAVAERKVSVHVLLKYLILLYLSKIILG